MAAKHKDEAWRLHPAWSGNDIEERELHSGKIWYRGTIYTPQGIVQIVYSEPRGTMLRLIRDGIIHDRRWSRMFQPRYLVTLAKRFADDVAQEATAP